MTTTTTQPADLLLETLARSRTLLPSAISSNLWRPMTRQTEQTWFARREPTWMSIPTRARQPTGYSCTATVCFIALRAYSG